ncbi:MAG: LLM class flavin-dependent oxidoreductase [Chloroflexota bacterium]|nr:LLM class flavin-dependent oxidoreductase [Chloroflexota bacterium]
MSTTRLRIGTMVICNDFRPPVQFAKEIATLHVVSGGRIELGLGAGFLNVEYEPLGIPFDPPGVRVLAIAAREAEIVGIQTVVTTSGDVVMEPGNLLAGTMRRKVDHIREAAGSRFDAIELNTTISIELTGDRKAGARRLIAERGWHGLTVADVLEMPALLIGTHNEMADQIRQRRDRFGLSYLVVGERNVESFAPLVTALAGT